MKNKDKKIVGTKKLNANNKKTKVHKDYASDGYKS